VTGAVAAVASALPLPAAVAAYLKRTPSAAELAQESEGYAEPGYAEHKACLSQPLCGSVMGGSASGNSWALTKGKFAS
jgi:hypothetical protein